MPMGRMKSFAFEKKNAIEMPNCQLARHLPDWCPLTLVSNWNSLTTRLKYDIVHLESNLYKFTRRCAPKMYHTREDFLSTSNLHVLTTLTLSNLFLSICQNRGCSYLLGSHAFPSILEP